MLIQISDLHYRRIDEHLNEYMHALYLKDEYQHYLKSHPTINPDVIEHQNRLNENVKQKAQLLADYVATLSFMEDYKILYKKREEK